MIQRAQDCAFLVAQMRSLIAQQSKRRGIGSLCTTKEVVTTGAGTAGYANKSARPICGGSKK
jgi:hypothetical protein